MKRREALKKIGTVFGYSVAVPSIMAVLQGCGDTTAYAHWEPQFLKRENGKAFTKMLDVIIPKTDSISATGANVHQFIDQLVGTCLPTEHLLLFQTTMDIFLEKTLRKSNKNKLEDLEEEDFAPILVTYLAKISELEKVKINDFTAKFINDSKQGESPKMDQELACYAFARQVRSLAITGYKYSEYVGEELMAYLPIPGEYVPCGNLEELTDGKVWSLG